MHDERGAPVRRTRQDVGLMENTPLVGGHQHGFAWVRQVKLPGDGEIAHRDWPATAAVLFRMPDNGRYGKSGH